MVTGRRFPPPWHVVEHAGNRVRLDVAGDDLRVVDRVTKAMRQAGIQPEEIEKF
jgi:hypothetical protein